MKPALFICLLILTSIKAYSQKTTVQGPGKIKGSISDAASSRPVEFATVTCFPKDNNNVAGGMITDEHGSFTIDNLPPGTYRLKVDFLGYAPKIVEGINISEKKTSVNIGTILITSGAKKLDDVTISASRNFMEVRLDKLVYNAEKDLTSQGGVATDILKKVPQVSVDVDGNIELLGNKDVRVFINGKPSTMFDNNLSEALQAIPANQIKSIEVITSPGAQYDAQGTAGIINIILKDNKSQGINGSIALSAGTRLENGSANIHAKKGKIDLSASLSGNAQLKGTTLNSLDRTTAGTNGEIRLQQNGTGTLEKNGYRSQFGFDWAMNKKNNLTASVSYNNFGTINNGSTKQQKTDNNQTVVTLRNSNNTFRFKTLDWNISYLKKFSRDGQELNISYQGSNGMGSTAFDQYQYPDGVTTALNGANGLNRLTDVEQYAIADYAQPLGKDITLNIGAKGSFSRINSRSDNYALDPLPDSFILSQTNNFNFSRDVYAAYASLTFPLMDKYSLKLGVRDEHTRNTIPSDTGNIAPSYNFFIPSVIISRKLKNNQVIKASYYRRLQRAGYRELNPFIDATDPTSLIQGNPYLKPERTNAGELSYSRFFEQGSSILVNLFYRNTQDDEQNYIIPYPSIRVGNTTYTDVTIATNKNAGHQQLTGINISGTLSLSQKLEVRGNVQIFNKYIVSNYIPGTTLSAINYRTNLNATYKFTGTLVAEFFGNFNSARTEIQGKFPSFTSYSFAIRQLLLNKRASIVFTTTDPFNRYTNQPTVVSSPGVTLSSNRRIPYQSFGLSFTYKFGKVEYKEKKADKETINPEDGG